MQSTIDSSTLRGHMWRLLPRLALGLAAAAVVSACGGDAGEPQAPAGGSRADAPLCPDAISGATPFIGGTGSGELATLALDTTQMTWTVTLLDSSVPRTPGTVAPMRSDPTDGLNVMRGALVRETGLPTQRQNKCAFQLQGASLDAERPARVFVGFGVAGGTIPGARIQFDGVLGGGAVPETVFPYFQFIGFTDIESDIGKIAGEYNGLGYHVVPTKRFAPVTQDFRMQIGGSGSFTVCSNVDDACDARKGDPFVAHPSGALLSTNFKGEVPQTIGTTRGHAYLIVGKLRGQLVPVLVRLGYTNDPTGPAGGDAAADDEIGLGILAPVGSKPMGAIDGQYVGVDSNFDYRATALVGPDATLLDPFLAHDATLATTYALDYAQVGRPGVVTVRRKDLAMGAGGSGSAIQRRRARHPGHGRSRETLLLLRRARAMNTRCVHARGGATFSCHRENS